MKDGFIIYKQQFEPIKDLPDANVGRLFKAIFEYQNTNKVPELDPVTEMAFKFFKNQFDLDNKKYIDRCNKARDSVNKRWNKKDTNVYEGIQPNTNHTDKEKDKDKEKDLLIKEFISMDHEPLFMSLGIDYSLYDKYMNEFKSKLIAADELKDLKQWLHNWLKLQPKKNFKYLTDQEKERRQVPKEWTYIFYEDTYKKLCEDENGYYVQIGREKVRV